METLKRVVRTVFLLAVFVAHPQPSLAFSDDDITCTPGCSANVRTLNCSWNDDDYYEQSTFCGNPWTCYYGSCCQSDGPAINMADYMWNWCYYTSISKGGGYPWFVMSSCQDAGQWGWCYGSGEGMYNHTSGTFYCSFDVQSCS